MMWLVSYNDNAVNDLIFNGQDGYLSFLDKIFLVRGCYAKTAIAFRSQWLGG